MKISLVALGKIGLPLAVQFAMKGHEVIGCDVNSKTVELVNQGIEPFPGEAHLAQYLKEVVSAKKLTATTDTTAAVAESDAVVVVVPLFVDGEGVANGAGVLVANITINTLGDIYATDIKPLYVQNINNVNRSNTQTESFKLVIQI